MKTALIAVLAALAFSTCFLDLDDGEAYNARLRQDAPLQGEELIEADIEVAVGTLQIEAGSPSQSYDLDLQYNGAFEPRVQYERDGGKARLEVALEGKARSVRNLKTQLNLRLNPDVPLALQTHSGVGDSEIDLSGMSVRSLNLESGVGETRVSMLSPNRTVCEELEIRSGIGALEVTGLGNFGFKTFRFHGGIGGSELDFSGAWQHSGEVEIEVGIGGVEIRLPRSVGAEIRAPANFLSGLNLQDFTKRGNTYYSKNIDRVDKIIRFRIKTGVGGVDVGWM
ncbi:MAG: hypothetical protein ACRD1R_19125 [Acidobacteriota bacterium]